MSREATGWICPKCGKGNAPWAPTCECPPREGSHIPQPRPTTPQPPLHRPNSLWRDLRGAPYQ